MGNSSSKKERQILMETYSLTPEQLHRVEKLYNSKCGVKKQMNFTDFQKLYTDTRFEHSEEDLRSVFNVFSKAGKMKLPGFTKLCLMCNKVGTVPEQERLRVLFDVMDCDCSGQISDNEFHEFLANFVDDKDTTDKYFSQLDTDNSKLIDFEEFAQFCEKNKRVVNAMMSYVFPFE